MTTDDLIAAILDLPCKIPPDEAMYGTYRDGVRAAAELVRQYAVSVWQWRDDRPVTENLVVSAGFTKVCGGDTPEYLSPESQRGGPVIRIRWLPWMGCDGWKIDYGGDLLPPFETMGQLHAACYGLGIELRPLPSPPEGETK